MIRFSKISITDSCLLLYLAAVIVFDQGSLAMKLMRILLVAMVLYLMLNSKKFVFNAYVVWLITFWAIATLSISWAWSKSWAIDMSKSLLFNMLCMYSILYLIKHNARRTELVLKTIMLLPFFLCMRVMLRYGPLAFMNAREAGGISGNSVGMYTAFAACIAYYFFLERKHRKYILWMSLNLILMLLSGSRKSILFFAIPFVILFLYHDQSHPSGRTVKFVALIFAGSVGLFAIFNLPVLYNVIGWRVESMLKGLLGNIDQADASTSSRMRLITWGLEWFREKMFLGYGIDNYRIVLTTYHPDWPISYYAHNNYIELLVDVGLLGTIVYYSLYVSCIFSAVKYRNSLSGLQILAAGFMVAIAVCDYGLVSYFDRFIQVLICVSCNLLMGKRREPTLQEN